MAVTKRAKTTALVVRRAGPEDAAAIASVHVTAWHEAYGGLLPAEMIDALTVEVRQAWWAQVLSRPQPDADETVYLAEMDGKPVGFGLGNAQRAGALAALGFDGEIRGLYVLCAAQGRGAGRSLVAAMARGLQQAGYQAAGAWVLRTNAPGRRFAESLGGTPLDGPEAVRGHGRFTEIAYGWRDLASLAAACDPGSRRN
ncbi:MULTISPECIES: GNAT family N-acetyltransferase [unclassified Methylobacterium]|jgi:L-amino acid N-acyltransferase YncA|uniref:GNAT family N-acetyltransferase n=1 Tax=unclassified Methylobacterium TaxID=2615210 RepID=UPI001354751D|nr:GNAT family N-acetyltransferase [Methylobacterium sp. 2A]MWV22410.1 GNAT family N-acetyltransferase [Methylobacterium sp. 2A]